MNQNPPLGIPQETPVSQPSMETLRQDVIEILRKAVNVINDYNSFTYQASASSTQQNFSGTLPIQQALENVQEIALRMAIVAPMKAGKSTIINGILGQPLLPARNTAMTAIPTEIILDLNEPEPILVIPAETLNLFQEAIQQIRKAYQANARGSEEILNKNYPHLKKTLNRIIDNDIYLQGEKRGTQNIRSELQVINDLVRLTSVFAPLYNPVKRMQKLPQIIVQPFQANAGNTALGNLVIIDTPGPNEAGENLEIKNIFEEQLKRSSLILVVLDFTQLNTEADKTVQDTVKEIDRIRGSKDSIYVLVNKVDQRRRGDMTTEEVRRFVEHAFQISQSHVFEVCAQRAYCAARFLKRASENLDNSWREWIETQELAQEILGVDWEETLAELSSNSFIEKAKRQWSDRSGFHQFCHRVINELMKMIAPKVIKESLNTAKGFLEFLLQDITLRRSAYEADIKKLQQAITELNQDISEINNQSNYIRNKSNEIKQSLTESLAYRFESIKQDLLSNITFDHDSSQIRFQTSHEAASFQQYIFTTISEKISANFYGLQKEFETDVEAQAENLQKEIEQIVQPILKRAQERLQQSFDVRLRIPNLKLSKVNFHLDSRRIKPQVSKKTETVIKVRKEYNRYWWHWLWLIPKEEYVPYEEEVTRSTYIVNIPKIQSEIASQVENQITELEKALRYYLEQEFKAKLEEYIQSLINYFKDYQTTLTQAWEYQQKSETQKDAEMQWLNMLEISAHNVLKEIPMYADRVEQFLLIES